MRNVDKRCLQLVMELTNLCTHLHTQLRVQVGERFVHQEYLRLTYDCTAERNTLSLTAGKRFRLSVEQVLNIKNLCRFVYAALNLILRRFTEL